jgi:hypothetical protein
MNSKEKFQPLDSRQNIVLKPQTTEHVPNKNDFPPPLKMHII